MASSKSSSKPAAKSIVDTRVRPVAVGDENALANALADGVFGERRRPTVAINDQGELVVCSRHTAKKHGWEVQGKLFKRERTAKSAATPAPVPAPEATPAPAPASEKPNGKKNAAQVAKETWAKATGAEELLK